ncbi:MAG: LysR family transcriptional regulator [Alphaproteobacteria bacterium]|nr:LysR family transcriptional regulator [Alphaproteobacteria bacterium]
MSTPFPIPFNALRAIEITARAGALGPAAAELGVTPGAVSQHIRRAEERLGLMLFERTPRGLIATPELEGVLPQLRAGFQALIEASAGLKAIEDRVLNVTTGNVFASRWLVWRIAKFAARHPEIEFRLCVTGDMLDLARGDIDCGIRFGSGTWSGVKAEKIGGTTYQPVCSPLLAKRLRNPADLAHVPVIRDEASALDWRAWWRAAGIADPPRVSGPVYSDPALAFDAAVSNQGVLLAVDMMSADSVSDGRLVRPFDLPVDSGIGYWLVTAEGRSLPKKVRALRDWLETEVPASACGYVGQLQAGELRLATSPVSG